MLFTTNDIAARLGVERTTAYAFVSFMRDMKLISAVGIRPNPTGKGKGSEEFSVPADCGQKFSALLDKLK